MHLKNPEVPTESRNFCTECHIWAKDIFYRRKVKFSVKFSFLWFHFFPNCPSIYSPSTLAVSVLPLVAALRSGFEHGEPNVWRQLSVLLLMGRARVRAFPSPRPCRELEGDPARQTSNLHSREFHLEPFVCSFYMCWVIAELLHSYQGT